VSWQGECITYDDIRFDMSQLRRAVANIYVDLKDILEDRLLFGLRTPKVRLDMLSDMPSNLTANFSFVRFWRNIPYGLEGQSDWLER
jgi:hypothetical protein